ncbi:MAG: glycosyltransferase family 4 protein [Myxococcota bacterium]
MRIAYVVEHFHRVSETFIRDLVDGLSREHAVHVFCANQIEEAPRGAQLTVVPFVPRRRRRRRDPLARRVRGLSDDALWFHRREAAVVHELAPALARYNPDVVLCEYGETGEVVFTATERLGLPLVVHVHGFDASQNLSNPRYRERIGALLAAGVHVIAPSAHLCRVLMTLCGRGHVHAIPASPDVRALMSRPTRTKTSDPSIVAVGRLTGKKCPVGLLETFARVRAEIPSAKMTWVGDGPERDHVLTRAGELALGTSFVLPGALEHERVLGLMSESWVFAQHSVTSVTGDREGLPVAIMEAMALGLPVVATAHSGIPEAVESGVTGWLANEYDFDGMARHLIALLRDEGLRSAMGERGQERARSRFNRDVRIAEVTAVLESAASGSPG